MGAFQKILLVAVLCTLFLFPASVSAQSLAPVTVNVGVHVVDVYEIDFPNNQVTVDFFLWFIYPAQVAGTINPLETFEIVNAKEVEVTREYTRVEADLVYQRAFVKAVIKKNWTVIDFPFDEHTIRIFLEDDASLGNVVYVPDVANSHIESGLRIPGWNPQPLKIEATSKTWESTLGDPALQGQRGATIPRILVSFMVERPNGGRDLFFKIFSAVLVSVAISFFSLLVSPEELEVRASLSIGSLFAAVGSQFVVSGILPESSVPTLVDNLHVVAYVFITLAALVAVLTHGVNKTRPATARFWNNLALVVLPVLFFIALAVLWSTYFGAGFFTPPTA
ncbi:MAG: hypothetical protein DDG60_09410 [Anaerolineae bacterium]|nr:MAG: hypothetical protein DDG60_09410 [Anaerolineae bacterium]